MKETLLIVMKVIIVAMAGGMITALNPAVLSQPRTPPSNSQQSIPTKSAPIDKNSYDMNPGNAGFRAFLQRQ